LTRTLPVLAGLGLLLTGCTELERYEGAFAIPSGVTVTPDGAHGPFNEPIGYVANFAGGEILALATRQGRFANERPTGSFLRGNPLPTGRSRVLHSLAAWSHEPELLSVFAADQGYGQLIEVPHIIGSDAIGPIAPTPVVLPATGPAAELLRSAQATRGVTTTETFTLRWRSEQWWIHGSRSGRLRSPALPDEPYHDEETGLRLLVGAAQVQDTTLSFHVDTGIVEHDLGEPPIALLALPEHGLIATLVTTAPGLSEVWWFEPASAQVVGRVELPADSQPVRLERGLGDVWIADAAYPVIWRVAPGQATPTSIPLRAPASDVAIGEQTRTLFAALASRGELWAVDLDTLAPIDLNPWVQGVSAFPLHSPIRGIGALPTPVTYPFEDQDGIRRRSELLAISLAAGSIVFFDQRSRCLVPANLGPRTQLIRFGALGDHTADFGQVPGAPSLLRNPTNDRSVVVNSCAGLARPESWRVVFDAAEQAWVVTGELSGEQRERAYEDQRYTSDRGEISFVIRSGTTPSTHGWSFSFNVTDGALRIAADSGTDINPFDFFRRQLTEVRFALPGDPVPFSYIESSDEPGWQPIEPVSFALVPIEGSNAVARIRPDDARAEGFWR